MGKVLQGAVGSGLGHAPEYRRVWECALKDDEHKRKNDRGRQTPLYASKQGDLQTGVDRFSNAMRWHRPFVALHDTLTHTASHSQAAMYKLCKYIT